MFYSETLLSKTGPLARVWLSANLERKLNKSNILQTNLEDSVNAIMDQGQAPMALRLSGQLLLGVARIYSRKARYLMDDCNEALVKIKMAFRPGNNLDLDLATLNPDIAAQNTLMPDTIAGDIPSLPMLDESLFAGGKDIDLPGFDDPLKWSTQIMTSPAVDAPRKTLDFGELYEDDLDLNLDLNDDLEFSIELGRDAQPEKSFADSTLLGAGKEQQLYDDDLGLPVGDDDDDPTLNFGADTPIAEAMDIDELPEESLLQGRLDQRRASASLSPARSSVAREADETFLTAQTEDPSMVQARQPAVKKRKVLPVDSVTEMKQQQIREMQNDRSAIIKAPSMLPKDPVLLALMEMQQKGLFVSSIMGDGRSKGWAPELRGILSIEVIRKNAKRKRREIEDDLPAEIALEIPEDSAVDVTPAIEVTLDEESMPIPGQEHDVDDEDHAAITHDTFDDTTIPLVHPEDQGPVSQATTHAVHLLRDRFGGPEGEDAAGSPKQQRQHVIFQQMFPESQTTKADATKMFFEVLVLATKDAIKVDQAENALGAPIKIRAKRGLWGAWAEEKAGGEAFGTQAETQAVEA